MPITPDKPHMVIGIQGGEGSYNHVAIKRHLAKLGENSAEIVYLYSSEKVLQSLAQGRITHGQFAISSIVGGYVDESLEAIADYLCAGHLLRSLANYDIPVVHRLMSHPSASITKITTVISHPQTFKQCAQHLENSYPQLQLVEGKADYIDPARVAKDQLRGAFLPTPPP